MEIFCLHKQLAILVMILLPILLPKDMCQKPTDLINETINQKTALYASLYWLMLQTTRGLHYEYQHNETL